MNKRALLLMYFCVTIGSTIVGAERRVSMMQPHQSGV